MFIILDYVLNLSKAVVTVSAPDPCGADHHWPGRFRAPGRVRPESCVCWSAPGGLPSTPDARELGVTVGDLYVPLLTFVFGEAQVDGSCATVSTARLRKEFYGLPADEALLRERLLKESLHELGHTFGLRHCADWRCVMASSYGRRGSTSRSGQFGRAGRKVVFRTQYW